jgi:hypothetical protein
MIEDLSEIEVIRKEIESNYKTPIHIVRGNKRFSWKVVLSTIPETEIYKNPRNIFKLILSGGRVKNFMNTMNDVFAPDLVIFYSKDYPLGNTEPQIIVGGKKVLCINHIAAQKLIPILSDAPFLEFIMRQYPNTNLEKFGLGEKDRDILRKETGVPKKNIIQRLRDNLFPKKGEEILKIDLSKLKEEERENFIKNFTKVINSEEEIKRKILVLKDLKRLIERNALEERFQEKVIKNPWIFGEEYFGCKPSRTKIGGRSIPDLRIKDLFNNNTLVIELKRAVKINKKDSRLKDQIAPNSNIMQALWQGIRYLEEQMKKGRYSLVYIVIGKGDKEINDMLNRINAHIHNIRFMTWDEIIDRANKRINAYKPFGLTNLISFLKKYIG